MGCSAHSRQVGREGSNGEANMVLIHVLSNIFCPPVACVCARGLSALSTCGGE